MALAGASDTDIQSLRETVRILSSQVSAVTVRYVVGRTRCSSVISMQVARLKRELGDLHGTDIVALRY